MNTDPRDETLGALYRGAAIELPRPAADAAVLRMARPAAGDAPSRSTRWGPRLALAATVVLAVGVVTRIQIEAPDSQTTATPARPTPTAGAEVAASAPASARETGVGPAGPADAPPAAVAAQVPRQRPASDDIASRTPATPAKVREQAGAAERQDAGALAAKLGAPVREKAENTIAQAAAGGSISATADSVARRDNRSRGEFELKKEGEPARESRAPAAPETRSNEPVQADSSAPTAAPFPAASAHPPMTPAVPRPAAKPATVAASPSAPAASMQASPRDEERRAVNDDLPEAMLTAEQWAARIAALRKSGRPVEANASLKRLMEKFPDFKVPAEARSPDME